MTTTQTDGKTHYFGDGCNPPHRCPNGTCVAAYNKMCKKCNLPMPTQTRCCEKCKRCGLPMSEWAKGRWENPLCKVGSQTFDYHVLPSPSTQTHQWDRCKPDCEFCSSVKYHKLLGYQQHECVCHPISDWEQYFDKKYTEVSCECGARELFDFRELKSFIRSLLKDTLQEERQFILNVLDGIDIADKEMGNKGGGTKAIRLSLKNRSI